MNRQSTADTYNESRIESKYNDILSIKEIEALGITGLSENTYEEWFNNIITCSIYNKSKNSTFLRKNNLNYSCNTKIFKILEQSSFAPLAKKFVPLKFVEFPINSFDLETYINENKKLMLMIKEITLLHFLCNIIQALTLCEVMGVPHGNLCLHTIYKKNKTTWEIAPPLYSQINLEKRYYNNLSNSSKKPSDIYAIDFCVAPEIFNRKRKLNERKY